MPAKWHPVSPGVWDRTFRALSVDAKVVAFNVYTSRVRVSEGLFELAPGHIAADTGLTLTEVSDALGELTAVGVVFYDAQAEVVLDPRALRLNPLRNGRNRDTGEIRADRRIGPAVEMFVRLPATSLKDQFRALAREHSPDLEAAIAERCGEPSEEAPSQDLPKVLGKDLPKDLPRENARTALSEAPPKDLARTYPSPPEGPRREESSRDETRRALAGPPCPHCSTELVVKDGVCSWCSKAVA